MEVFIWLSHGQRCKSIIYTKKIMSYLLSNNSNVFSVDKCCEAMHYVVRIEMKSCGEYMWNAECDLWYTNSIYLHFASMYRHTHGPTLFWFVWDAIQRPFVLRRQAPHILEKQGCFKCWWSDKWWWKEKKFLAPLIRADKGNSKRIPMLDPLLFRERERKREKYFLSYISRVWLL